MTAYLIVYGTDPSDRLAAYSFPDRIAARMASLPASGLVPRVPPDAPAGGCAYVVENEEDVVRSPLANQLVALYNGLTTDRRVSRFESRSVGVRRLLALLASIVRPPTGVALPSQEKIDMARVATVGEFRPIRRASKLGRIVAAVDGTSSAYAVASTVGETPEDVVRLLKMARREHGVDYSQDADTGVLQLVLPEGIPSALEPERITAPASTNGATKVAISESARIKLLVDKNPKRPTAAAHERFALYRDGMTVGEFLAAGGTRADLSWDRTKHYVTIK